MLIDVLAHAVNDLVELAGNDGVFSHPAGEHVGGGVEEPPRRAVAPVEGGILPLAEDVRDTLDADDVLSVKVHDGVVGALVREGRGFVQLEGAMLRRSRAQASRGGVPKRAALGAQPSAAAAGIWISSSARLRCRPPP